MITFLNEKIYGGIEMKTLEDLIAMKVKKHNTLGSQYRWLILAIEDNMIYNPNGAERVRELLDGYDNRAHLFIIGQLSIIGKGELAKKMAELLDFDFNKTKLSGEYADELLLTI